MRRNVIRVVQTYRTPKNVKLTAPTLFYVGKAGKKKAFEEQPERRRMRLKESKVVGEGVAVLVYERAA